MMCMPLAELTIGPSLEVRLASFSLWRQMDILFALSLSCCTVISSSSGLQWYLEVDNVSVGPF